MHWTGTRLQAGVPHSAGLLQLPHGCGDAAASSGGTGGRGDGLRAWLLALEIMEDEDDEVGQEGVECHWSACSWHHSKHTAVTHCCSFVRAKS